MKRIVILGGGESGVGSAILAQLKGFDVFLSDKGKLADKYREELQQHNIPFEEEQHTEALILNADEVIKSPGIPEKAPLIQALYNQGIPVIGELEFAQRYTDAKMICITGTNGKTTTTLLTYHLLKAAGLNVGLGGNVGQSFARQVALHDFDHYVLEISSFQLDNMYAFRAHIAVLTNITPDHLDRYDYKLENYIKSKFRITRNQQPEDLFLYCEDDPLTLENLNLIAGNPTRLGFSVYKTLTNGAWLSNQQIHVKIPNQNDEFDMFNDQLALKGKHNTYNSMAAAIVGKTLLLKKEVIRESLSNFQNIEHRLESVGKVKGIEFINDSKATNVNSSWYALESMDKPVIWIAGGVDKGNDYTILQPLVKDKVRIIVCLGKDNRKIHEAFSKDVEMIVNTLSAQEAVHVAYHLAKQGEIVLLSPACASFDLFENYEDRGRQFKRAVKNL